MHILSQLIDDVNGQLQIGAVEKWRKHKISSIRMAAKMIDAGYDGRGARMAMCGDTMILNYCVDCGHYHVARASMCRDKLCPICAWRLSLQRYADMSRVITALIHDYTNVQWAFITLTAPNCEPAAAAEYMKQMSMAWDRLMKRRSIKSMVLGYARSTELTYNATTDTIHPHYHAIVMLQPTGRPQAIIDAWLDTDRLGAVAAAQNVQQIRFNYYDADVQHNAVSRAVLETYKYAVKSSDMDDMPMNTFKILVRQLANRRMTAFGGVIKKYKSMMNADTDDLRDDENDVVCAECGNADMQRYIARWAYDDSRYHIVDTLDTSVPHNNIIDVTIRK